jgi:hypothetical protein
MGKHADLVTTELGITVNIERRAVIVELTGFAPGSGGQAERVWQEFSPSCCRQFANALLDAASEAQGNGVMAQAIIRGIDEDDGA